MDPSVPFRFVKETISSTRVILFICSKFYFQSFDLVGRDPLRRPKPLSLDVPYQWWSIKKTRSWYFFVTSCATNLLFRCTSIHSSRLPYQIRTQGKSNAARANTFQKNHKPSEETVLFIPSYRFKSHKHLLTLTRITRNFP
jgi:hypothetical protein